MRPYIYARVSTPQQSVAMQLAECNELCRQRKWKEPVSWVDHATSGAIERRVQLDAMMDAIRRGKCDVLVVYRFDRFARSTKHLITTLDELRTRGIEFVSVHESIDTSTPTGKLAFTIFAAVAEFERELIKERVRSSLAARKAAGQILGRPVSVSLEMGRQIAAQRELGTPWRAITTQYGVTRTTAQRAHQRFLGAPENPSRTVVVSA